MIWGGLYPVAKWNGLLYIGKLAKNKKLDTVLNSTDSIAIFRPNCLNGLKLHATLEPAIELTKNLWAQLCELNCELNFAVKIGQLAAFKKWIYCGKNCPLSFCILKGVCCFSHASHNFFYEKLIEISKDTLNWNGVNLLLLKLQSSV